jgi:hypothetical protein
MAAGDLYTGITVQGLYNEQTGDALYGVLGSTAPASALFMAGKDSVSGNLVALSTTGGNLNVNATITPPSDSTATGTITNTQNVAVSTAGTSALMVQIEGTWTGTVVFEVTLDGTNWQAALVYPVFPDASPAVSSATANGNWTLSVGGVRQFRVRGNTVATGTATVFLTAGQGQYGVVATSPVAANFLATVTQGTSPWVDNLTQVAGVALGATAVTAFGTAPAAANVIGTNSSIYAGTTALTATGSSLNVNVTNTVTVTGTVAVTQSTSPWVVAGNLTHNNAAPAANNVGALVAVASTAAPTYTAGDQVLLSTDLAGNLRTSTTISGTTVVAGNLSNNNAAPAANNVGVLAGLAATAYTTNTYTTGNQVIPVTDLHGALNSDLQAWHGTELGAATNFGTTPGAVIVGQVNASIFQGTAAISTTNPLFTEISDGTNAMGTMANWGTNPGAVKALNVNASVWGTLTNNNAAPAATQVGVLPALANAASPADTEGDQVLLSVDLSGRIRVRGTLSNNNAAPSGDNVGVLPAITNSGTFPAVTVPALTAGDQELATVSQGGSLVTIPADEEYASHINYFSADTGDVEKSVANPAILPVLSVRTNSASIQFLLRSFVLQSNGTLSRWQLIKNATLTGSTFAATSPSANMQVDTAATSFTGGTVVDSGFFSGTQLYKSVTYAIAAGAPGDHYTMVCSSISGTTKVSTSIQWSEVAAAI